MNISRKWEEYAIDNMKFRTESRTVLVKRTVGKIWNNLHNNYVRIYITID